MKREEQRPVRRGSAVAEWFSAQGIDPNTITALNVHVEAGSRPYAWITFEGALMPPDVDGRALLEAMASDAEKDTP